MQVGNKLKAANIRTESLPGLGRGTPRSDIKSFAAAGNKIFKQNGEKVKNLSLRVRKHASS